MVGGVVVNAPAFIGCNYLVRAFGGEDAALEEKSASTRLLRSIKRLTQNTRATARNFSTGLRLTPKLRRRPSRTSPTQTMPSSSTTRPILTNQLILQKSPSSLISINQASSRKMVNVCLWAPGLSLWATQRFVSFKLLSYMVIAPLWIVYKQTQPTPAAHKFLT